MTLFYKFEVEGFQEFREHDLLDVYGAFPPSDCNLFNTRAYQLHLFNNPLVLLMFVTISVTASWTAFEYFEKPAQKYLRERYSTKQREMPVVVDVEEKKRQSETN